MHPEKILKVKIPVLPPSNKQLRDDFHFSRPNNLVILLVFFFKSKLILISSSPRFKRWSHEYPLIKSFIVLGNSQITLRLIDSERMWAVYTELIHKISRLFHDRSHQSKAWGIKTLYLCIQNHTQVTLTVEFTIYRNHLGFIFAIKFELRLQYHIKRFYINYS